MGEQAAIYAPRIDRLKDAGAECTAITSLGGHLCFEETQRLSSLPLVSAISPLDAFFDSEGLDTIGVLGTRVVMRSGFYGSLEKDRPVVLPDQLEAVGQTHTDMAVTGRCTPAQRSFLLDAGQRLIGHGAQAVVLGGTDLNLAFDGQSRAIESWTPSRSVDVLAHLATGRVALADP